MSGSAAQRRERQLRELVCLQRLLLVDTPERAEQFWRRKLAFEALPAEIKAGHELWLQYEGESGFIHYTPDGQGRYYQNLPKEVAPETLLRVPFVAGEHSLLERVQQVAAALVRQPGELLKVEQIRRMVSNLELCYQAGHGNQVLRRFQEAALPDFIGQPDGFLKHLATQTDLVLGPAWQQAESDGQDATGFIVLRDLAQQLLGLSQVKLLSRMLNPTAESALHLAVQIARDALQAGLAETVRTVAVGLRQQGADTLAAAREGFQELGRPESLMENFYWGLFLAAPLWRGAQLLFEVLERASDGQEAEELGREANVAEEHLVRLINSLAHALDNLDGEMLRRHQREVALLRARGDEEGADKRLLEIFDFHFFYPNPLRKLFADGTH